MRRIATDPEAFEAFYRRHVEAITRFLARRVDDPHTVADLVAEVFVAVLDSAHTYREENSANGRVFDLKGGVVIHPDQLAPGQTAVLEVMENTEAEEKPSKPQVAWSVRPVVAVGKIAPCV